MNRRIEPREIEASMESLRRLALALVQDACAADDAVQETVLQALLTPPRAGPTTRAWFATVLRNGVRKTWRENSRRAARERRSATTGSAARDGLGDEPLRQLARTEVLASLITALHGLTPEKREAVELRYLHGLAPSQIALRLDCPVGTVKTRLKRGLHELRVALDDSVGSDWCPGLALAIGLERADLAAGALAASSATSSVGVATWIGVAVAVVAVLGLGLFAFTTPDTPDGSATSAEVVDTRPARAVALSDAVQGVDKPALRGNGQRSQEREGGVAQGAANKHQSPANILASDEPELPKREKEAKVESPAVTGVRLQLVGLPAGEVERVQVMIEGAGSLQSLRTGPWSRRLFTLRPGTYTVSIKAGRNAEYTSRPLGFEVVAGRVTGPLDVLFDHSALVTGIRLRAETPSGTVPAKIVAQFRRGKRVEAGKYRRESGVTVVASGSYELVVYAGDGPLDLVSEPVEVEVQSEALHPDVLPEVRVVLSARRVLRVQVASPGRIAGRVWIRYAKLMGGHELPPSDPTLAWMGAAQHEREHPFQPEEGSAGIRAVRFGDLTPDRYIVAAFADHAGTRRLDHQLVEIQEGIAEVTLTVPAVEEDEYILVRLRDPEGNAVTGLRNFEVGFGMHGGNGGSRTRAEVIEERDGVYALLPMVASGPLPMQGPRRATRDTVTGHPWSRTSNPRLTTFVVAKSDVWGTAQVRGSPEAGVPMVIHFDKRGD